MRSEKLGRICGFGGEGESYEAVPFCYEAQGSAKYSLDNRGCSLEREVNWYQFS